MQDRVAYQTEKQLVDFYRLDKNDWDSEDGNVMKALAQFPDEAKKEILKLIE